MIRQNFLKKQDRVLRSDTYCLKSNNVSKKIYIN